MDPRWEVSIVVPTLNRAKSLNRLLGSLDSLEYPGSVSLEVLIVDNGSTDETETLLRKEQARARNFSLRVLQERKKGKAHALNRGLREAKGKVLSVLDDDVMVDARWLKALLACVTQGSYAAFQGRILPGVDPDGNPADPRRLREYNIPVVDHGEGVGEVRGMLATNMIISRSVLEKVGYFDTRLGRGASEFGEDSEFSGRVRKAGYKIGYAPKVIVYHELDPSRYGRAYNRRMQFQKGISRCRYAQDSIPFKILPNLFANIVRFLFYYLSGNRQKLYKTEGRVFKYVGYLAGRIQGWRSKRAL